MTNKYFSRIAVIIFTIITTSFNAFSQTTFSVTNTIGANKDSISDKDFVECTPQSELNFYFADRLQLDVKNNFLTGRARLSIEPNKSNGNDVKLGLKGFITLTPFDALEIAAGNSFSSKYSLNSFNLQAYDETEDYGLMLTSGIGMIGKLNFENYSSIPLIIKLAAGIDIKNDSEKIENLGYTFSYSLAIKKLFAIEGVVTNINNGFPLQTSVAASINFIKDLKVNGGYIHNLSESEILTEKSQDLIFFSAGYYIKNISLGIYADYITGLNKNYISKKGEIKENETIPYAIATRITYNGITDTELELTFKYNDCRYKNESSVTTLLLQANRKLDSNNSITTGIRVSIDEKIKDENNKIKPNISFPLTWRFQYGN